MRCLACVAYINAVTSKNAFFVLARVLASKGEKVPDLMMTLFTAAANKIKCQTSSHIVTHFDEMHATNDDT